MYYRSHWLRSFLLSLFLHIIIFGGIAYIAPKLMPKEEVATEVGIPLEMDVPGDGTGGDPGSPDGDINGSVDGEVPKDTEGAVLASSQIQGEDNSSEPEPAPEENIEETPEPNTEGAPILSKEEEEALEKYKKMLEEARKHAGKKKVGPVIIRKGTGGGGKAQMMGQPPKLIEDSYPAVGLTKFHGRVTVFATIGTNGRIIKTKIAVGTKSRFINEIAMAACRRWRFKPALNSKGQPMECIRIISIPFNVPNIERQLEEEKVKE